MKAVDAHTPDSATTALNSPAMYCTGVPLGGVVRSCTRDLTTSARTKGEEFDGRQNRSRLTQRVRREPVGDLWHHIEYGLDDR
jgi:hypothetical protein